MIDMSLPEERSVKDKIQEWWCQPSYATVTELVTYIKFNLQVRCNGYLVFSYLLAFVG